MTDQNNPSQQRQHEQPAQPMHFVYIVRCANGSLYTGYATDVHRRVATHNAGKGARYTRSHLPVTLLVSWPFRSKGEALRAEQAIKRLPRAQKVRLIEQTLQGKMVDNKVL